MAEKETPKRANTSGSELTGDTWWHLGQKAPGLCQTHVGPRCYNGISGGSIQMLWPRGASLGSAGSHHLIHTPVSPGLPENQGLEESPTPGGVAKEELGSRLSGVVLVNGQTAEGADKLKAGPGSRSKKASHRKTDETELPNSRPRLQGLGRDLVYHHQTSNN